MPWRGSNLPLAAGRSCCFEMRRRFKPYVMLIQRPVFSKFTPFRAFSIKSIEFCTFSSLSNNFGQNPSNFGHFPAKYFGQSPRNPVSCDRIQQNAFRTHSGTKFRTNSACPALSTLPKLSKILILKKEGVAYIATVT